MSGYGAMDESNPIFRQGRPRQQRTPPRTPPRDYGYLEELERARRAQRGPTPGAPPRAANLGSPAPRAPFTPSPRQPNIIDIIRRAFTPNPRPQPGPGAVAPGYSGGIRGPINTPYGAMGGGAAAVSRGGNVVPSRSGGRGGGPAGGDFSFLDQLDAMRNRPMPGPRNAPAPVTEEEGTIPMFGKSLSDYLSGIDVDSLIAEEMGALDSRENALRGQASAGDAELAKIYQWLVNQIGGQDAQINTQYQQAQQATRQNMQSSTDAIVKGGASADQQLAEAFGNLGIDPGAGTGNLAEGRSAQVGDVARTGQINADYLNNTGVTQRNLNRENRTAAGYRGAEERAAMQRDLANFLAEIQGERSSVRARGTSQAQQMAQAQYEADMDAFMQERDYSTNRDDEAWNRELETARLQLDQGKAARSNRPPEQDLTPFDSISQRLAQTQGARKADSIMNILATEAQNSGNLDPAGFARRVHQAAAKAGLGASAALEAHAAAEQYWQAYRD